MFLVHGKLKNRVRRVRLGAQMHPRVLFWVRMFPSPLS